jgi:hypothetical protein
MSDQPPSKLERFLACLALGWFKQQFDEALNRALRVCGLSILLHWESRSR